MFPIRVRFFGEDCWDFALMRAAKGRRRSILPSRSLDWRALPYSSTNHFSGAMQEPFANLSAILDDHSDDLADVGHLISPYGSARGQHENAICEALRCRQERFHLRESRPIRLHAVTTRIEIPPRYNIFGMQNLKKLIAAGLGECLIDF